MLECDLNSCMTMKETVICAHRWRRNEPFAAGPCLVRRDELVIDARYELGTVHTGKARVFVGYFTRLNCADGHTSLGGHPHSLRKALQNLVSDGLAPAGYELLNCAALDDRWFETGLSANSGFGYLDGQEDQGSVPMISSAELDAIR